MTVVGILGAGQLGRMLALAGYPLGLRFRFYDPAAQAATDPMAKRVLEPFEDIPALADFAEGLDVVTFEFENVPVSSARWLSERLLLFPPPRALEVAQDRLSEKSFFRELGAGVPDFAPVAARDEFEAALVKLGYPCVLKTRRFGYDGKGQRVLRNAADADAAWRDLKGYKLILEAFVPFAREVSLISVRGRGGELAFYPLVENHHSEGILRRSLFPAPDCTAALQAEAEAIARRAMEALGYVGVLAIEFFLTEDDRLLVNEMAPRVHNSGHATIEGAETSQFENHLRAVLGWPLGSTAARGDWVMENLIGDLPDPAEVLARPGAHLHLYGKSARPGRKVGHLTTRR